MSAKHPAPAGLSHLMEKAAELLQLPVECSDTGTVLDSSSSFFHKPGHNLSTPQLFCNKNNPLSACSKLKLSHLRATFLNSFPAPRKMERSVPCPSRPLPHLLPQEIFLHSPCSVWFQIFVKATSQYPPPHKGSDVAWSELCPVSMQNTQMWLFVVFSLKTDSLWILTRFESVPRRIEPEGQNQSQKGNENLLQPTHPTVEPGNKA